MEFKNNFVGSMRNAKIHWCFLSKCIAKPLYQQGVYKHDTMIIACIEMLPFTMNYYIYRCRKWVQNTRREDIGGKSAKDLYTSCRLCSAHFEDSQFMNANEKKRLIWTAVPTLFEFPNSPPSRPSRKRYTFTSDHASIQGPPLTSNQHAVASDQPTDGDELSTSDQPSGTARYINRESQQNRKNNIIQKEEQKSAQTIAFYHRRCLSSETSDFREI